jgi:hypothetical protein
MQICSHVPLQCGNGSEIVTHCHYELLDIIPSNVAVTSSYFTSVSTRHVQ